MRNYLMLITEFEILFMRRKGFDELDVQGLLLPIFIWVSMWRLKCRGGMLRSVQYHIDRELKITETLYNLPFEDLQASFFQ